MKSVLSVVSALCMTCLVVWTVVFFWPLSSGKEDVGEQVGGWMKERILESPAFVETVMPIKELPVWVRATSFVAFLPDRILKRERFHQFTPGVNRIFIVFNKEDGVPASGLGIPAAVSCLVDKYKEIRVFIPGSDPFLEISGPGKDILLPLCYSIVDKKLEAFSFSNAQSI